MSFYAKISLCALLAIGSILGMEQPPRLKHPATSTAAQALNQPMIEITCNGARIDKIQKNYLEASETLKNLLDETEHTNSLELPEALVADYQAIKDLLVLECQLQNKAITQWRAYTQLSSKTERQLVEILNACQRFELNHVSEAILVELAGPLARLQNKNINDLCLYTGSYELPWTHDVARLVAKEMCKNNPILYLVLTNLTERKNGIIKYWHVNQKPAYRHIKESTSSDFFRRNFFHLVGANRTCWLSECPELINAIEGHYDAELRDNPTIMVNQVFYKEDQATSTLYWKIDPEITKIAHNLKPEQVTILIKYWNKFDRMPLYLQEVLPLEIRKLLFPNWWQRRSWASKAALITGGAAATGLAAWLGYKYYSKK